MWNLTLDDIYRAKEELKGRRAAIQARYNDEVKTIEADLVDIETLERVAGSFVEKHKADVSMPEASAEPTPAAGPAWGAVDSSAEANSANWRTHLDQRVEADPAAEPETADAGGEPKGASRWRMHLGKGSDD